MINKDLKRLIEMGIHIKKFHLEPNPFKCKLGGAGCKIFLTDVLNMVQQLREMPSDLCQVCWTSSGVPVPMEEECRLKHPHEGEHERCDYCWIHDEYMKLKSKLDRSVNLIKEGTMVTNADQELIWLEKAVHFIEEGE